MYVPVKGLGEGAFGAVLKSMKIDTNETVAVKVVHRYSTHEVRLLKFLMQKNLDRCNIVRFIDSFKLKDKRRAMVFEMLDVTLLKFMRLRAFRPLCLSEVRSIIHQMAIALDALKSIQVIHADIKTDNIMLVDHKVQPLRVKLIDFGHAFKSTKARQGDVHQVPRFRAPEIFLGLPFSEAIDMWSLGIIVLAMVFGVRSLSKSNCESDVLHWMIQLLGAPADHLLDAGVRSNRHFHWSLGHWRLNYYASLLDDVEKGSLEKCFLEETGERRECIDLLMAMLRMDPSQRITPTQVLAHPFIIRSSCYG